MFFNFGFNCRIMCANQQHRIIIFKQFKNTLQIIFQLFSAQNAFFYLNRKWLCDALPDRVSVLSKEFQGNPATNCKFRFFFRQMYQFHKPHLEFCRFQNVSYHTYQLEHADLFQEFFAPKIRQLLAPI